jgi:large subunit ribosomal protein L18
MTVKKMPRRRRRENKTNYKKRVNLLKSGIPRIVFRKSNKYIIAQYVTSKQAQDKIEFGVVSKELTALGWPKENSGSLKSMPAAYLTGFLMGKKIQEKKLENPIIDFGMNRMLYKTKTYAFLKGIIDSGIKIESKEEVFPEQDRIQGKHLKTDFSKTFEEIKSKIDKNGK